jgi:hypothetical protein
MGWPRVLDTSSASFRATISVEVPGANWTTNVSGREGNSSLKADDTQQKAETSTIAKIFLTVLLDKVISHALLPYEFVCHLNR